MDDTEVRINELIRLSTTFAEIGNSVVDEAEKNLPKSQRSFGFTEGYIACLTHAMDHITDRLVELTDEI